MNPKCINHKLYRKHTFKKRNVDFMQKPKTHIIQMASAINQHRIAISLKFSVITIAIIALYSQDLGIVFNGALHDETTYHILVIPFLFVFLLYRKRKMVNATLQQQQTNKSGFLKYFSTLAGITLCATVILTYWYGSYTFTPLVYHLLTLPILAAGLILILFNAQALRQLVFPIAFLIFLTPPPEVIFYTIGSTLSNLTASVANTFATTFGMNSTLSSLYGSPLITLIRPDQTQMRFSVDVACSGIYSLVGFVIFALFIAYITRGRLLNKLIILIMGIPLIIALNIIRITAVLAIGYYYGDQLALQVFHTIGSAVLMFLGTILLLAITEKVFKKPKPSAPCKNCSPTIPNPPPEFCTNCGKLFNFTKAKLNKNDLAKIAGIAIIVAMLLSIQVPIFALTQGPAQIVIQTPSGEQGNIQILPQINGYKLDYVYRDTAFEQASGQDASLIYVYGSLNGTKPTVWVTLEIATTQSILHGWETCLITFPISKGDSPSVTQFDLRDIQTQENPPIIARYFAFQYPDTNQTEVVLYWYATAKFDINGTTQLKQVKMSLVAYIASSENVSQTENELLPIATAINEYWQPIGTWSAIALIISQNGLLLSIATTALLVALILYRIFLNRQEKLLLQRLYDKLSAQDQLLIKTVNNAAKQGNSTTLNITNQFQKLTETSNSETETWVNVKLQEVEAAGLIEKNIANKNDIPTINWKSRLPDKAPFIQRILHKRGTTF